MTSSVRTPWRFDKMLVAMIKHPAIFGNDESDKDNPNENLGCELLEPTRSALMLRI